ncbi:hypothetical protein QBC40DRAFT_282176 [Triangularia verruculosa]|uniref:Uncharacterized protein n=1 Tax=Triangularia verruculosa TaxID=2587418 RepID=A0AAN6XER7_9PEZI|nr:hypothetical protein QBC40DRAFT_282176 [Triangularia verruculosa]
MAGSEVQQSCAGAAPRATEPKVPGNWPVFEPRNEETNQAVPAGGYDDDDDEDGYLRVDMVEEHGASAESVLAACEASDEENDFGVEAYNSESGEEEDDDFGVESCADDEEFAQLLEGSMALVSVAQVKKSEARRLTIVQQQRLEQEFVKAYKKRLKEGRVSGYEGGYPEGLNSAMPSEYKDPFEESEDEEGGKHDEDNENVDPDSPEAWQQYKRWLEGLGHGYDETYRQGYDDGFQAFSTIPDRGKLVYPTFWGCNMNF